MKFTWSHFISVPSNLYTSSHFISPWSYFSDILKSATSWQSRINPRQQNGNKQSENPPGVKTWRTYHNTVSKPRASLLHSFPLVSCLSSSPSLTHLSFPCLSHRLVAIHISSVFVTASCVCPAAFTPDHHHRPTHQPLLTFDLDSPTCLLKHAHAHTLHTSCSVSFVHLWRQTPFNAAD